RPRQCLAQPDLVIVRFPVTREGVSEEADADAVFQNSFPLRCLHTISRGDGESAILAIDAKCVQSSPEAMHPRSRARLRIRPASSQHSSPGRIRGANATPLNLALSQYYGGIGGCSVGATTGSCGFSSSATGAGSTCGDGAGEGEGAGGSSLALKNAASSPKVWSGDWPLRADSESFGNGLSGRRG